MSQTVTHLTINHLLLVALAHKLGIEFDVGA